MLSGDKNVSVKLTSTGGKAAETFLEELVASGKLIAELQAAVGDSSATGEALKTIAARHVAPLQMALDSRKAALEEAAAKHEPSTVEHSAALRDVEAVDLVVRPHVFVTGSHGFPTIPMGKSSPLSTYSAGVGATATMVVLQERSRQISTVAPDVPHAGVRLVTPMEIEGPVALQQVHDGIEDIRKRHRGKFEGGLKLKEDELRGFFSNSDGSLVAFRVILGTSQSGKQRTVFTSIRGEESDLHPLIELLAEELSR